jgi:predicted transcriptional regulator
MILLELKKPIRSEQDFKALVDSGDITIIGPHALVVYLVINAEQTFPTVKVLCKKSGISEKPVRRSLMVLEEYGYIGRKETKQAQGCSTSLSGRRE